MFKVLAKLKSGWSEWQAPTMDKYKAACCDCGLIHDMQFKVVEEINHAEDGTWEPKEIKGLRVIFRARRKKRKVK